MNQLYRPFCWFTLKFCQRLSFLAIWWQDGKGEIFTWKCSSMKTLASLCCCVKYRDLAVVTGESSSIRTLLGLKMPFLLLLFLSLVNADGRLTVALLIWNNSNWNKQNQKWILCTLSPNKPTTLQHFSLFALFFSSISTMLVRATGTLQRHSL